METARSLFFRSSIPQKYWSESILCATYLINRLPLQSLDNVTPFFKLTGTHPSLDHLKVFGSLCSASTIADARSKFDQRSVACAFLGYPVSQKGYKVLNLKTDSLFISREMIFHENHFPFHTHTSPSEFSAQVYLPYVISSCHSDTPSVMHFNSPDDVSSSFHDTSDNSPDIHISHTFPTSNTQSEDLLA